MDNYMIVLNKNFIDIHGKSIVLSNTVKGLRFK